MKPYGRRLELSKPTASSTAVEPAVSPSVDRELPESPAKGSQRSLGQSRRFEDRTVFVFVVRLGVLAGALGLWQWLSGPPTDSHVLIDEFFVSEPTDILTAMGSFYQSGVLIPAVVATFQTTLIGFFLAVVAGVVVGFLFGVSRVVTAIFQPFMTMLYSVPRIALIPLFLLWFGLGMGAKVAVVFTIVFFLIFNSTYSGVKDVNVELIDTLRLMGAKRRHVYFKVMLPSAMVWIVSGLRTSVPYAMVGAVTAEMLASNRGIGSLVIVSSGQFNTAGVLAAIFVLVGMSLVLMFIVSLLERRVLGWKTLGEERRE